VEFEFRLEERFVSVGKYNVARIFSVNQLCEPKSILARWLDVAQGCFGMLFCLLNICYNSRSTSGK